jgi:hypothetical protein
MNRKTLYRLLASLSVAGYSWLTWNCTELASHAPAPGMCLFKAVTHLPCPSCGTTRAIALLLHGSFARSLLLNPFGAIISIALILIPIWLLADLLMKRESLHRWYSGAERALKQNAWISIPLIVLVIANWFWNISKEL